MLGVRIPLGSPKLKMMLTGLQKIQISVTDMCNRQCNICPHSDPEVFPNKKVWMEVDTAKKLAEDLVRCDYKGIVSLSGYGEPLLHPKIFNIIAEFTKRGLRTRIFTNADLLYKEKVSCNILDRLKLEEIVVTTYDGEQQLKDYTKFMKQKFTNTPLRIRSKHVEEIVQEHVITRFSNRAGILYNPIQNDIFCYRPLTNIMIDWDGSVLICCEDWVRTTTYGNILETPFEDIWLNNPMLNEHRKLLIDGKRSSVGPCANCNYIDKQNQKFPKEWL